MTTSERVGVDVVSVADVEADVARWGETFLARVLTENEIGWCRRTFPSVRRVAACLAVKEAAIKVLGGRPAGFTWQQLEVATTRRRGPGALRSLADEVRTATGGSPMRTVRCRSRAMGGSAELWAAWGLDGTARRVVAVGVLGG